MLKLTLATLIGLSCAATSAQTRCAAEVKQAVNAVVAKDFVGQPVITSLRDANDVNAFSVTNEMVDVLDQGATAVLGTYFVTVDETCRVISGPTLYR